MSDALSFAEIDGQYVELLPARTVMTASVFGPGDSFGTDGGTQNVDQSLHDNSDGDLNNDGANGSDATGRDAVAFRGAAS